MIIARDIYLKDLISLRHNGMIKIVTGIRRCGKSFLLFEIFSKWLREQGVDESHIIKIDLENRRNAELRDPDLLIAYIDSRMTDESMYYIMIDEIQMVKEFEDVLNSYLKIRNADVYVTGSNARFLSKDVITTFRGRGFEVKVNPLSFSEFYSAKSGMSVKAAYDEYSLYGGLPQVVGLLDERLKSAYLKDLYTETYLRDIQERYQIKYEEEMNGLLDFISSAIGSLTNPTKLTDTLNSAIKSKISRPTVVKYIEYMCDAFLVEKALRYDVKGKRYFDTQFKYYFSDMGLRNARLNFRQVEPSHIMENIIYNELKIRGYNVDVGIVPAVVRNEDGVQSRSQFEIDFVCNQGSRRYYVQSAYRMESEEKKEQEKRSLLNVDDSFKKIIIVGDEQLVRRDNDGITTISIFDFLLNNNSLEF